ncbi:MAG: hypothetical protein DWQ37_00525 [Planctomycetota bacterium]|nr:MAG: hypothetical protein DWQ37_00525 [Planctomycetota bacterium]
MKSWAAIVCFAATLAAVPASRAPASDGKVPSERIDALVRDLGSDKFATREQASRRLRELGIVTRESLERAASDPDAEVRLRARSILAEVRASDFEARVARFLADNEGSGDNSLPAWAAFSERFGSSRLVRELFVEMHRSEPALLEAMADGTESASAALDECTREILDAHLESQMDLGTLASLLFVGSDEDITVDERRGVQLYPYVVHSTYRHHYNSPLWTAVLKKLVADWLVRESTPLVANQNLIFAAQLELRPEALEISKRVLAEKDTPTNTRVVAIRIIGHFNGTAELAAVEKQLSDATTCAKTEEPQSAETQVRDVALLILLRGTGQEPGAYGCEAASLQENILVQTDQPIFLDDARRQAALQKWKLWREENPQAFED